MAIYIHFMKGSRIEVQVDDDVEDLDSVVRALHRGGDSKSGATFDLAHGGTAWVNLANVAYVEETHA